MQILQFVLTYGFWASAHIQREYWAMTKKAVMNNEKFRHHDGVDIKFLGSLDSLLFLTYSISQFVFGSIGDRYNKRTVLSISYSLQALCFLILAYMQIYDMFSNFIFYSCFFLIGLTQSVVFPILVSIIGAYFSKGKRGMVAGVWATSTNIGNIIGL